jgi:hypothetical protein
MWPNKKSIIIAVSVAVLLIGSIAGVVLAQGNDNSQSQTQGEDLLAKVCTIYQQNTGVTIDEAALKTAFTQAQNELQLAREKTQLQNMVSQGKITQDQADQYLSWWQSRPNVPFGFGGGFHAGFPGRGGPCAPPATAPSTAQ